MKKLILLLLFTLPLAAEDLSCFKVHDMWANDPDHYGVEWTNSCRFELPAIYVAVEFWDGAKRLGAGYGRCTTPDGGINSTRGLRRWTFPGGCAYS